jgi:hypothetical protein
MITAEHAEFAETMDEKDKLDSVTRRIIGATIEVHKHLEPGVTTRRRLKDLQNEFILSALSAVNRVVANV